MSPIPREQGSISINTLQPICLQNVIFKWVSVTILLMMEDIVAFATPPQQTAFIKGCSTYDHIWDVQGAWEAVDQRIFVSAEFSKAYHTVHHNYLVALFMYIALLPSLISLLMLMLKAPLLCAVG